MEGQGSKKILILNLGGIGDILLSTPALRALRQRFPQSGISILTFRPNYEAVKDLRYIENIFLFEKRPWLTAVFKNLGLLFRLRKEHFELAVNMRTMLSQKSARKIKLLLDIIHPRIKAGRDTEGRGSFWDIKIPETNLGEKYEREYDLDTVKALGVVEVRDKSIDFEIEAATIAKISILLSENGVLPQDLVMGIHPGGKPAHRWPIENFSRVIQEISKKMNCKFIVTGSFEEAALGERLKREANGRLINFSGRLTLKELGALIKRCSVYICNDTASMHIAALAQVPMVAIFTAGYLKRFDPRNISDKAIVLSNNADCAPCDKLRCSSMKCVMEITPRQVMQAIEQLLGKT